MRCECNKISSGPKQRIFKARGSNLGKAFGLLEELKREKGLHGDRMCYAGPILPAVALGFRVPVLSFLGRVYACIWFG